jgi:hypothetical protein
VYVCVCKAHIVQVSADVCVYFRLEILTCFWLLCATMVSSMSWLDMVMCVRGRVTYISDELVLKCQLEIREMLDEKCVGPRAVRVGMRSGASEWEFAVAFVSYSTKNSFVEEYLSNLALSVRVQDVGECVDSYHASEIVSEVCEKFEQEIGNVF